MLSKIKEKLLEVWSVICDFVLDHLKLVIVVGTAFIVLFTWFIVSILRTYTDYNVKKEVQLEDSEGTAYESFDDYIVKYNSDGAFLVTQQGEVLWNETYDMSSPMIEQCEDYLIIYEKGGTSIYVMTVTGKKGLVETNRPIMRAHVSEQGHVAVLMSDKSAAHIQICDYKGGVIAAGVTRVENGGYPLDIAYSRDGERLALSSVDVKSGKVQTTITFYDFSNSGKKEKDNIIATSSFPDLVISKLHFLDNGRLVAFGDREVVLFSSSCKIKKEIFAENSVEAVFYNGDYFGYIGSETTDDGELVKVIHVYGSSGWQKFAKALDASYTYVEMLRNNDIIVQNENEMSIYTKYGIKKFFYAFENNIIEIIPNGGRREYVLYQNGVAQHIRLR